MVLKFIVPIVLSAALMDGAMAADYRPGEYLKLDMSKAVLSPARLGPAAHFESLPVEARSDGKSDGKSDVNLEANADVKADQNSGFRPDQAVAATQPEIRPEARPDVSPNAMKPRMRIARPIRPGGEARTRLAHRRGNPLDAQAMDSHIQTWPCRPGSGGICGWK